MMKQLAVIMPVYNEEGAIKDVVEKWTQELNKHRINYNICVYNDGSKDNTAKILEELVHKEPRLIAVNKANSGHGPTILTGYRQCSQGYDWIFQIDSDDEMGTVGFIELWNKREDYDFLLGIRDKRVQQLPRKIISAVSRLCIKTFYGTGGPWDVNSPYRLIRSEKFKDLFNQIPDNTFAPNVIISGYAAKKKLRVFETPVKCTFRTTGEVSIKKWKLLKAAAKSFVQTIKFSFEVK